MQKCNKNSFCNERFSASNHVFDIEAKIWQKTSLIWKDDIWEFRQILIEYEMSQKLILKNFFILCTFSVHSLNG